MNYSCTVACTVVKTAICNPRLYAMFINKLYGKNHATLQGVVNSILSVEVARPTCIITIPDHA